MRTVEHASTRTMEDWYAVLSQRCSRGMVGGEEICERILNTTVEMLGDRGYTVSTTLAEMKQNIASGAPTAQGVNDDGDECFLFVDKEERTGVKTVRTLMEERPRGRFVVVSADGPTPFTRREFTRREGTDGPLRVQFFRAKELVHNVTRHAIVPKHEAVPATEVEGIKRQFCILDGQWPIILTTDPVVRWYAWAPDTIVRIHRRGLTQDKHTFYRRVVHATE